jgi:undecaprenyl-diphosphatase
MNVWQAIFLGVVQGVTEFLPISSTAHLLLVQEMMGRSREELKNDPITVVIQLGTLFAVILYFRYDLLKLLKGFYWELHANRVFSTITPEGKLAKLVIVATIPALVLGGAFSSKLKTYFYNAPSIAVVSIIFALLLRAAEVWSSRRQSNGQPVRSEWTITWGDALFIGLFQAFALMPGGSRSGTTLTACLFLGLARPAAAKFSFYLSIPAIFAAGMKDLIEWIIKLKEDPFLRVAAEQQAVNMLVGTVVSFLVGYACIAWLMKFLQRYSTNVFVIYRLALGVVILALYQTGRMFTSSP